MKLKLVITGLRALDLSGSAMSRMREEVLQVDCSTFAQPPTYHWLEIRGGQGTLALHYLTHCNALALVCSPLLVTYNCASDESPVGHGDERAMDNG